jgi:hypothetical protein
MTPRQIIPPTVEHVKSIGGGGEDVLETHPAFGLASVHRSTSTPGEVLFQSDLRHTDTITLEVHRTERQRSLAHDWTHPRETLIEIQMSLAQWGALISSQGIGAGVPVTIRATETDRQIPGLPYESRLAVSIGEVKGAAADLIERAEKTLVLLNEAIDSGKIGAIKKARDDHARSLQHLASNSEFYVKSMADAAEKVVSNARADIEAHILNATRLTGSAGIEAPDAPVLQIGDGS